MIIGEVEGQRKGGKIKMKTKERRREGKAVKLIFCAEPYTATDMLRQKPRPEEAAWV